MQTLNFVTIYAISINEYFSRSASSSLRYLGAQLRADLYGPTPLLWTVGATGKASTEAVLASTDIIFGRLSNAVTQRTCRRRW